MKLKKKDLILPGLAITLALAVFIGGGTYSYLNSSTGNVVNEFDANQVSVILAESTGNAYHIIPGTEEKKDPTVTLKNRVDAYVFVKVTDTTDGLVTYKMADGWTLLDGYNDVYYREVAGSDTEQVLNVLEGNKVSYDASLENSEMLDENGNLKEGMALSFQAYAIQQDGFNTASIAYQQMFTAVVSTAEDFVAAINDTTKTTIILNDTINLYDENVNVTTDKTIILENENTFINSAEFLTPKNIQYKELYIDENATLTLVYPYDVTIFTDVLKSFAYTYIVDIHIGSGKLVVEMPSGTREYTNDRVFLGWKQSS